MRGFQAHVISCLLAEIERRATLQGNSNPIRILDAGCGRGDLISEIMHVLRERGKLAGRCELYGLIAIDRMAGKTTSCDELVESLKCRHPEVGWRGRIRLVPPGEPWPFEDRYFDITIASQVLEHSRQLGWYLEQCYRALRRSGIGLHCFEAKEMSWALGILPFLAAGSGLVDSGNDRTGSDRICRLIPSWKRFMYIGERVGFKVSPRYNVCLLRRRLSGDSTAYRYSRNLFDNFAIRLMARWSPVTLISEKV